MLSLFKYHNAIVGNVINKVDLIVIPFGSSRHARTNLSPPWTVALKNATTLFAVLVCVPVRLKSIVISRLAIDASPSDLGFKLVFVKRLYHPVYPFLALLNSPKRVATSVASDIARNTSIGFLTTFDNVDLRENNSLKCPLK